MTDEARPEPTYVRVYADSEGESHFEDVYLPSQQHSSPTGAMEALTAPLATEGVVFRTVLSEASETIPYNAPRPLLIVRSMARSKSRSPMVKCACLGGERPGPVWAGSALVVEDTTGKGHLTRNVSGHPHSTLIAALP